MSYPLQRICGMFHNRGAISYLWRRLSKMATSFTVLVFLLAGLSTKQVYGYYCDSDRCDITEYCCGSNICCTSYAVWQMWYFWCGIVFFLILLSACVGCCRYRYYQTVITVQNPNSYSRLDNQGGHIYPTMTVSGNQYPEYQHHHYSTSDPPKYTPEYPPPPYAQTTTTDKDPDYLR